jgi:hypothetical protein
LDNTRPTPLIEDLDGTRRKLEAWISAHRGHTVSIHELSIPEATGTSNVTPLSDITWQEDGQHRSEPVVARLQPSIERPVFPDYDLSLQYEVMESIGRHSDIPVPQLRGLETDKSLLGVQFYLMKRTEGRIPTDMPPYNMDGWMMHETSVGAVAGGDRHHGTVSPAGLQKTRIRQASRAGENPAATAIGLLATLPGLGPGRRWPHYLPTVPGLAAGQPASG